MLLCHRSVYHSLHVDVQRYVHRRVISVIMFMYVISCVLVFYCGVLMSHLKSEQLYIPLGSWGAWHTLPLLGLSCFPLHFSLGQLSVTNISPCIICSLHATYRVGEREEAATHALPSHTLASACIIKELMKQWSRAHVHFISSVLLDWSSRQL